ncbi:helix-turn-helix domain-containing protein [Arthrobacter sp. LAPM80]|uniref:helix-turn-helix domain-containing protein n=1 Tax=Arthrobacter sp. LAPM80 TaxID=3141788 RepID=UPI00398AE225
MSDNSGVVQQSMTMPVWPDVGRALGIGRSTTYELVKRDEFPIRILRLGSKRLVSRADLMAYLGETAPDRVA